MKNKTYIYLAECEGFVKVGKTNDIKKRLKSMSTGCPFPIRIICSYCFELRGTANVYENEAHVALYREGLHHNGEWFSGDLNRITEIVNLVMLGTPATKNETVLYPNNSKRFTRGLYKAHRAFIGGSHDGNA